MHNLNFITFYLQFILILAQSAKCVSLQNMVSFLFHYKSKKPGSVESAEIVLWQLHMKGNFHLSQLYFFSLCKQTPTDCRVFS